MRCEERFYEIYGKDPVGISFCPYRICPIGAHSDHNLGKITGLAIDKGIHIAYKPKMNGVVEMCSLQFPKRAQWHIREIGEKTGDWADYLRGATWALSNLWSDRRFFAYRRAFFLCGCDPVFFGGAMSGQWNQAEFFSADQHCVRGRKKICGC